MKLFVACLTAGVLAKPNANKRKSFEERRAQRKIGKSKLKSILRLVLMT